MERLTKDNGKAFEPFRYSLEDISTYKIYDLFYEITFKVLQKLGKYEDAEEQGLLLRLPCKIGADVYIVPSEMNFRMNIFAEHPENNRVYHQKVALISFTENGWYMEGDKDRKYDTDRILPEKMYKETWFLSREEAEAKLKEMEEKDGK